MRAAPPTPWTALQRDLDAAGITHAMVAARLHVSRAHVTNVLAGRVASRRVVDGARELIEQHGRRGAGNTATA